MDGALLQRMLGPDHADVYEVTYRSRGKDWPAEARDVTQRARRLCPDASSLLDVACGCHAAHRVLHLLDRFEVTNGGEQAGDDVERATQGEGAHVLVVDAHAREPALGPVAHRGRYLDALDVIEARSEGLEVCAGAAHLTAGGVLVVEPWWLPEKFIDGYVGSDLVHEGDRVVARVSHTRKRDHAAHMEVRWLVGEPSGLRSFTITEVFALFTRDEYFAAFENAGCAVEYHEGWLTGRGIFTGVRRA